MKNDVTKWILAIIASVTFLASFITIQVRTQTEIDNLKPRVQELEKNFNQKIDEFSKKIDILKEEIISLKTKIEILLEGKNVNFRRDKERQNTGRTE